MIKSVISQRQIKCLTHCSEYKLRTLDPLGVPLFYSQLNPSPNRSLASMDFSSMLILDSPIDKNKLPKSFILIQAKVLPHSRTLVPYPLISSSDIFRDNLGLAEITSASRPGHVAPRLTRRRHLGHVLVFRKYILTTAPQVLLPRYPKVMEPISVLPSRTSAKLFS